jgi:hypothetical protein
MPKVTTRAQWRAMGWLLTNKKITRAEFDKRVHGVDWKSIPEGTKVKKVAKKKGKIPSGLAAYQAKKKGGKKSVAKNNAKPTKMPPWMIDAQMMPKSMKSQVKKANKTGRIPRVQ